MSTSLCMHMETHAYIQIIDNHKRVTRILINLQVHDDDVAVDDDGVAVHDATRSDDPVLGCRISS